eukprot:gnl/Chilomastix_cuspidata/4999.p1 GENE.gnl/Chilomastix_cuspidata/4999~~gnl/Chilomastix_cuspidata/4999.p1  ORF type:complete len:1410 (+),score=422.88 gnl/Chilomastix_cuspidata/4999:156-4385(+)
MDHQPSISPGDRSAHGASHDAVHTQEGGLNVGKPPFFQTKLTNSRIIEQTTSYSTENLLMPTTCKFHVKPKKPLNISPTTSQTPNSIDITPKRISAAPQLATSSPMTTPNAVLQPLCRPRPAGPPPPPAAIRPSKRTPQPPSPASSSVSAMSASPLIQTASNLIGLVSEKFKEQPERYKQFVLAIDAYNQGKVDAVGLMLQIQELMGGEVALLMRFNQILPKHLQFGPGGSLCQLAAERYAAEQHLAMEERRQVEREREEQQQSARTFLRELRYEVRSVDREGIYQRMLGTIMSLHGEDNSQTREICFRISALLIGFPHFLYKFLAFLDSPMQQYATTAFCWPNEWPPKARTPDDVRHCIRHSLSRYVRAAESAAHPRALSSEQRAEYDRLLAHADAELARISNPAQRAPRTPEPPAAAHTHRKGKSPERKITFSNVSMTRSGRIWYATKNAHHMEQYIGRDTPTTPGRYRRKVLRVRDFLQNTDQNICEPLSYPASEEPTLCWENDDKTRRYYPLIIPTPNRRPFVREVMAQSFVVSARAFGFDGNLADVLDLFSDDPGVVCEAFDALQSLAGRLAVRIQAIRAETAFAPIEKGRRLVQALPGETLLETYDPDHISALSTLLSAALSSESARCGLSLLTTTFHIKPTQLLNIARPDTDTWSQFGKSYRHNNTPSRKSMFSQIITSSFSVPATPAVHSEAWQDATQNNLLASFPVPTGVLNKHRYITIPFSSAAADDSFRSEAEGVPDASPLGDWKAVRVSRERASHAAQEVLGLEEEQLAFDIAMTRTERCVTVLREWAAVYAPRSLAKIDKMRRDRRNEKNENPNERPSFHRATRSKTKVRELFSANVETTTPDARLAHATCEDAKASPFLIPFGTKGAKNSGLVTAPPPPLLPVLAHHIRELYNECGAEVIRELQDHPAAAVPIVLRRLTAFLQNLREIRAELESGSWDRRASRIWEAADRLGHWITPVNIEKTGPDAFAKRLDYYRRNPPKVIKTLAPPPFPACETPFDWVFPKALRLRFSERPTAPPPRTVCTGSFADIRAAFERDASQHVASQVVLARSGLGAPLRRACAPAETQEADARGELQHEGCAAAPPPQRHHVAWPAPSEEAFREAVRLMSIFMAESAQTKEAFEFFSVVLAAPVLAATPLRRTAFVASRALFSLLIQVLLLASRLDAALARLRLPPVRNGAQRKHKPLFSPEFPLGAQPAALAEARAVSAPTRMMHANLAEGAPLPTGAGLRRVANLLYSTAHAEPESQAELLGFLETHILGDVKKADFKAGLRRWLGIYAVILFDVRLVARKITELTENALSAITLGKHVLDALKDQSTSKVANAWSTAISVNDIIDAWALVSTSIIGEAANCPAIPLEFCESADFLACIPAYVLEGRPGAVFCSQVSAGAFGSK